MMVTAWQTSALDDVPERLVRFGRIRAAASVAIVEDDRGVVVEVRFGRRLLERIVVGARDDANLARRLVDAITRAQGIATNVMVTTFAER
jgi:hypothetical protein